MRPAGRSRLVAGVYVGAALSDRDRHGDLACGCGSGHPRRLPRGAAWRKLVQPGRARPREAMTGRVTVIVTPRGQPEPPDDRGQLGSQERGMSQPCGRVLVPRMPGRDSGQPERGSLTLMLAVMFVALLALAGLVIDGGAKLTAAENAASAAQEAARAGAGMVDRAKAYASGNFVVDQRQAIDAADQYLANAGYNGEAKPGPAGVNSIRVTVTVTRHTRVLSIIGIDWLTSTGMATATLKSGVTGPGQ